MEDGVLKAVLRDAKTIAVVGLSDKQDRPSFSVAEYLDDAGYEIIPVNPMIAEWKGRKSYAKLSDVPSDVVIDVVDIFRKSEEVLPVVKEAMALPSLPKLVWLQEGVESEEARKIVEEASMKSGKAVFFSQNKCIRKEHERLGRQV